MARRGCSGCCRRTCSKALHLAGLIHAPPHPTPCQALRAAPPQRSNRKQAALEDRSWLAFLQHVKGSSGEGLWPTPSLPFLFAGALGAGLRQRAAHAALLGNP